jgi:hypothetical protein
VPSEHPTSPPTTIDHPNFGKLTWDPGGGWDGRAVTRLFGNRARLVILSPVDQSPMKLSHYVRYALTGKRPPTPPTPAPSPPTERQCQLWRAFLSREDVLFAAIGEHLFARYLELRDAASERAWVDAPSDVASAADIWKHAGVFEVEVPMQDTPTPLLTLYLDWPWDPEHGETAVSLRDWRVED